MAADPRHAAALPAHPFVSRARQSRRLVAAVREAIPTIFRALTSLQLRSPTDALHDTGQQPLRAAFGGRDEFPRKRSCFACRTAGEIYYFPPPFLGCRCGL